MSSDPGELFRQPLFVMISFFGCVLVIIGLFDIGTDDFFLRARSNPNTWSLLIGILLTLTGITLYVLTQYSLGRISLSKIKRLPNGYSINNGRLVLNVLLGRIEETPHAKEDCVVALPANEYFDDECINDTKSALGAYMHYHFKGHLSEIQSHVNNLLRDRPSNNKEKRTGVIAPSYGVGNCLYLDNPLSSNHRIAMVAVTTQRANEGLQSHARYIFDAIASIQHEMANDRPRPLYMPLLGSGHGGLKPEVSLVCMLIALTALHKRHPEKSSEQVNIVVYKADDKSSAAISKYRIQRALSYTKQLIDS